MAPVKLMTPASRQPAPGRRVQCLLGLTGAVHELTALPDWFLEQPVAPPEALLSALVLGRRTSNVLRRFVAACPSSGRWTYRRLIEIPGFGLSALADLLVGQRAPRAATPSPGLPRRARIGRTMSAEVLQRALEVVARVLPASEADIARRLIAAGLGSVPPRLAELERASRFLEEPSRFAVLRRPWLVLAVAPDQLALAHTIHSLASRRVRTAGSADIADVALRAGTDDLAFVRVVVSARGGFRWLSRRADRFDYGFEA